MSADDNAPEQARVVEVVRGVLDRVNGRTLSQKAEAVLAALAPLRAAERQEAAREAWDAGYETGRDDECFDQRGLSTDSDAHEYPHANPYRADGATTPTIPANTTDHGQQETT